MRILFFLITIFLLQTALLGQKSQKVFGHINDKYTFCPIEGAYVLSEDSVVTTYSDSVGFYQIIVPKRTKFLYFHHDQYYRERIRLHPATRVLNMRMKPVSDESDKYGSLPGRNAIAFLPTKLIWGALGIRYERFIGLKYSVGLYADWYYKGKQYFGEEEYTGIKAIPTFRHYLRHHKAMGFYFQASAIIGYFDFSVLNYVYRYDAGNSYSVSKNFWTGGAGFAIGGYFAYGKTRHIILDLNVGFQFLPANYPMTKDTPYGEYEHWPTWWYVGGPGSIIEIKIGVGGIF